MSPDALPKIISVDDHLVEPPELFLDALPEQFKSRAPHVERRPGRWVKTPKGLALAFDDHPDNRLGDFWIYDDLLWPLTAGYAAIGELRKLNALAPVTYDEINPACHRLSERLKAMDSVGVEGSLCFPTMPRFCGQHFAERPDKAFALICLQAYNDWILDVWCAGAGYGRMIPVTVIPLWDAELAAAEVRRCAAKGARGISFSECPPRLGLPSIHSGYWNPVLAACDETGLVVNMHIGTSSRVPSTGPDSPHSVEIGLIFQNSQAALVDWLTSGLLEKYPRLKIALSEGQVGWMPYVIDRLDSVWERSELYEDHMHDRVPRRPSEYIRGRVYGCLFDDIVGLRNRDALGMSQLMFEVDFPHADSTFPYTREVAARLVADAGLDEDETRALVRGSAIECYNLEPLGLKP